MVLTQHPSVKLSLLDADLLARLSEDETPPLTSTLQTTTKV